VAARPLSQVAARCAPAVQALFRKVQQ